MTKMRIVVTLLNEVLVGLWFIACSGMARQGAYMRREAMMKIRSRTAQTGGGLSALSSCASNTHAFLSVDLLEWQDSLKTKNPTAL